MTEVLEYIETFHKYITPGKGKKLTALFAVADTIRDKARAAVAEPIKNCDVGTAEEQAERYGRYCDKFMRDGMHCENCPCCGKIPYGKCEFAWAQMPYEEGGEKCEP